MIKAVPSPGSTVLEPTKKAITSVNVVTENTIVVIYAIGLFHIK